ncbi:TetR/AcrR family transcriptional regulator [Actinacidiphila epipremni]|jgi:AcrR family transcriptional regulator|uniref:TetR/AcrR family transcriptional regulator n=1 Tax=Actinacidiphila epipremni TaxID=2053013 RepID=A0ABX0ZQ68_9ACTN|nr:TetR/AcrR family transcriptional regulator [Actinacidiphila epipremni]NJP44947.1 TetR/AcrR family transcriptional regulator [Actinacidiphila epipremni]
MRKTADERRTEVVRAAVQEFSRRGLHGTSTDAIARAVGVSQPYLFRLYNTKLDIFLAAGEHCFRRTSLAFEAAAHGCSGECALKAMSEAYRELAVDRELLMMQMQLYVSASCDEQVRQAVSRWWDDLWELVTRLTGLPDEAVTEFMSGGMLINVMVALGIAERRPVTH